MHVCRYVNDLNNNFDAPDEAVDDSNNSSSRMAPMVEG